MFMYKNGLILCNVNMIHNLRSEYISSIKHPFTIDIITLHLAHGFMTALFCYLVSLS